MYDCELGRGIPVIMLGNSSAAKHKLILKPKQKKGATKARLAVSTDGRINKLGFFIVGTNLERRLVLSRQGHCG